MALGTLSLFQIIGWRPHLLGWRLTQILDPPVVQMQKVASCGCTKGSQCNDGVKRQSRTEQFIGSVEFMTKRGLRGRIH